MTTIAVAVVKGVLTIASDSRGSNGSEVCSVPKLHRLPGGRVVGFCGDIGRAWRAFKWIRDGQEGKPPILKEVGMLIVSPDGTIECAEERWTPFPVTAPVAIGSGGKAAMVAMNLGKTPTEAVVEASKVDGYTFGPVVTMTVTATPKKP